MPELNGHPPPAVPSHIAGTPQVHATPASADPFAPRFHGIFERLRQLDVADLVLDNLYDETGGANFWDDYCGDDLSDLAQYLPYLRPGQRVLELASGAGRLAIEMARAGAWVDGLELSPAMRQRAAQRQAAEPREVAERLRWLAGDMAAFTLPERYDLVVLGATSLCLLLRPAQRASVLRAVRQHLAPGGRFVFDLAALQAHEPQAEFTELHSRPWPDGQDFAIVGQVVDRVHGLLHLNVYRERIAWDGHTHRMLGASVKACIDRAELRAQAEACGLVLVCEAPRGPAVHCCARVANEVAV